MKENMMYHLIYGIIFAIFSIWIGIEYDWATLLTWWSVLIASCLPPILTLIALFSIMEKEFKKKLPLLVLAVMLLLLIHLFLLNHYQSTYILLMNVFLSIVLIICILIYGFKKRRRGR